MAAVDELTDAIGQFVSCGRTGGTAGCRQCCSSGGAIKSKLLARPCVLSHICMHASVLTCLPACLHVPVHVLLP